MVGSSRHAAICLFVLLTVACGGGADVSTADRVFTNGAIYTVDPDRSWAEAVAIANGKIVYVGDQAGLEPWIGESTRVSDLDGKMLLPGIHDSHIHILIGILAEEDCSLELLQSVEAIEARLEQCTALDGYGDENWIFGGGWLDWVFPEANPNRKLLDRHFPDRPVYLRSSFGHAAWVNARALELAGIDAATPNPPGGVIERDPETGEPTGTLRESAMMLVLGHVPESSLETDIQRVRAAIEYANSFGITSVIEPGFDGGLMTPLLAVDEAGDLTLRTMVALSPINWQAAAFDDSIFDMLARRAEWRRPNINVDSIKIYIDGVIEYGTAAMLEPYENAKWGNGMFFYTQEEVDDYLTRFDAMGINIQAHAIGDAGIRMALDGFEAMRETNGYSDNRHQVIHLQLIDDTDIPRFSALDIGANFQALWAFYDDNAVELSIPAIGEERGFRMYPIGRVIESGGRYVGGSDYDVTSIDPLLAIEVGITRQDPHANAGRVMNAEEAVDLETMIDAYTINGAWQMGLEDVQGSIEVGKRADLVILDRNLFGIPASEISDATVVETIFDGRTVYKRTSN